MCYHPSEFDEDAPVDYRFIYDDSVTETEQEMKKKLFRYYVLLHEFDKKEDGSKIYRDSKLVIEPKNVLALTEKEVVFKVTREIPEEYATEPDNVEIVIGNF